MTLGIDLRHAARGLTRKPGFTFIAVWTLALGIAATTTMFAVVHHLFMAPLPFAGADRLAYVVRASDDLTIAPVLEVAAAWRQNASTLEWVEPFEMRSFTIRLGDGPAEVVTGGAFTPSLATRLGVSALIGRSFSPADSAADAAPVVLVGEQFWRTRLGAQRHVIGTVLRMDGIDRTIIGIMPAALSAHHQRDRTGQLWVPFTPDPSDPMPMANVLVKLGAGATPRQAEQQLDAIAATITLPYPLPGEWQTRVEAPGALGDNTRRAILILFGAVGLVLLIACANVSGLLLARGADRRQEVAVRAALGASAGRITRLLLVESVLLASLAAIVGIVLAHWGVELIRTLRPNDVRSLDAMSIAPPVIAFALLISTGAALITGVMPALHARHVDLIAAMRGGASEQPGGLRARRVLIAAEIALCMVLVLGATLLMRTVADLQSRDLGYDPAGVLAIELNMPRDRYPDAEARQAFATELLARVRALPGVAGASAASSSPVRSTLTFGSLTIQGSDAPPAPPAPVPTTTADEQYLQTLGVPLRAGRYMLEQDPVQNPVVVNESFARRHWAAAEGALGQRIRISERVGWLTIVGVVGDVTSGGLLGDTDEVKLHTPINYSLPFVTLLIRVAPDRKPLGLLPSLQSIVHQFDADMPLRNVATLEQQLSETIARERFVRMLLMAFGLLAMVLVVTGLYGLISYSAVRRTREIGIRMALGASRRAVHLMLFRDGAVLVLAGIMTGGLAALAAAALLRSLLHGIAPWDPAAVSVTVLTVGCAAGLAVWLPARRATLVDPQVAVRAQ